MHTVTKSYRDFPAAHRQPNHDGHCRLIHGHNWGFDIEFTCVALDSNGFVIDVGKLGKVKEFLAERFDHTLLLNSNDDHLQALAALDKHYARLIMVPNCGMEGLAEYVYGGVKTLLRAYHPFDVEQRGLAVSKVVCWEDSKNCATYIPASPKIK